MDTGTRVSEEGQCEQKGLGTNIIANKRMWYFLFIDRTRVGIPSGVFPVSDD